MTLNVRVTDDQLGAFYRKTAAIADRLGKSLSFDEVMQALQIIHDGERPLDIRGSGRHVEEAAAQLRAVFYGMKDEPPPDRSHYWSQEWSETPTLQRIGGRLTLRYRPRDRWRHGY